jgi:hypothetical protein
LLTCISDRMVTGLIELTAALIRLMLEDRGGSCPLVYRGRKPICDQRHLRVRSSYSDAL